MRTREKKLAWSVLKKGIMTTSNIDDSRIETRFVWGRCAAKDARSIRALIRAFQSDGWPSASDSPRKAKRGNHR